MAQVGPLRKHLGPGCARLLRLCSRCCSVGLLIWLLSAVCTVIPTAHYSIAEEVSADVEAALSHFQVERVR
jgi:hypothetical protein